MSDIVQLTPNAANISMDFMRRRAPDLARDIVCRLDTDENLALQYGLSEAQWMILKAWPAFKQMLREANEELGGSAGTGERARRKAALAIAEVGVVDMATIMGDPKANQRDRIAAFDQLKDVAMLGSKQQAAAAAVGAPVGGFGGPLIQIVLPTGSTLNVGEADLTPQIAPAIEGEATRIEPTK